MSSESKDIIEFTLLFNRYKISVFNYVLKMINDRMQAEDIVQNVFLKLFENINSIKNRESIRYWIYTTARNEVYTYIRGKKTKKDQHNVDDTDEIDISGKNDLQYLYELKEMKELIDNELNCMPPEQREVFILKEYGSLSYQEIASLTGIDEGLVKSRLHSVRQKLIKKIVNKLK